MTQAYNLSQFANNADANGKISNTALTGLLPIANGGTNNASLGVTAGGVVFTNGSQFVNTGAGTSGQFLTSNGASAPTWATSSLSALVGLSNINFTSTNNSTASGLNLTSYDFLWINGNISNAGSSIWYIGTAQTFQAVSTVSSYGFGMLIDLNNGVQYGTFSRASASVNAASGPFINVTGYTKSSTSIVLSSPSTTITGYWQITGLK